MGKERTRDRKTVFITVSRGFIVRNILRSGVLRVLTENNFRVVVFLPVVNEPIPDYLQKEFAGPDVVLEGVIQPPFLRFHSFFKHLTAPLTYTEATAAYREIGNERLIDRSPWKSTFERFLYSLLSRLTFLKFLVRFIEYRIFYEKAYQPYFDKYEPSAVFATSIVTQLDIDFMKEARRRGIPTIAMPKGWDNVTKLFYHFVPDTLLVQTERMREPIVEVQRVPKEQIVVTGFPQFDFYAKPDLLSREQFFATLGLDPKSKLIFFGSEGAWAPEDVELAEWLTEFVKDPNDKRSLVIRPHYSDVTKNKFDRFTGLPNVFVDRTFRVSTFFIDNWDPGMDQVRYLTNLLYHCDVLVTVASTLSLDAVCFNKPIINVAFGVLKTKKTGEDLSGRL